MSLNLSAKQESNIKPIEPGMYAAVCHQIIDLGDQYSEQYDKWQHRIVFGFEIPGEEIIVNGEAKSRTMSKTYTASLNPKASLRKELVSWRGKPFTIEEENSFDPRSMLGKPCMLNITNSESNGKTYANIASINPMPKGMNVSGMREKPIAFDIDTDDLGIVNTFPQWLQDKIKSSRNYEERMNGAGYSGGEIGDGYSENQGFSEELKDADGDLPF